MAEPASLAIHLLGHPRFVFAGASHKFSAPPRTLPLLAFLLLNRGPHLMRDSVAFTLWPDESEETARTNLRRHLNYLKNALPRGPEPWFLADAESISWNEDSPAWVDIDAFQALASEPQTMAEAVACYAGDLLTGFYDDWLIGARERLRGRYIAALEALLLDARSRRNLPQAIDYARRILREDPWREDALRQLVAVRYESGDRTGALTEFEQFAIRLRTEAGIEPMPETIALRDAVLRGAYLPESLVPREEGQTRGPSGASLFPFIGRQRDLEHLKSAWTRAARGRGSLVLIGGEAGSGKSRIASELALVATAQGGRVLRGASTAPEQRPYQAIASALHPVAPMLAALDIRPVWLRALAAILPEIESGRGDLQALPSLDPERERTRLFEALSTALSTFSRQRPTLLIIEDLHWAGVSTIAAIEYLARRAGMQSLLIVGTYRADEPQAGSAMAGLRRRLSAEDALSSIALGGLSESDVRDLAAQVPAMGESASDLARDIFTLSNGNALFVCELVRDRIESRDAPAVATHDIRATIAARAERLSPAARTLADAASVVGATFDIDVVGRLAGADESIVVDGLAELLDRRIIKAVGHGHFEFAFTHNLIQMTLYDALDERTRKRWHKQIAGALAALPDEEKHGALRSLAWHFEASGQPSLAADAYLDSARGALAVFALDEAFSHASRGLSLPDLAPRRRFDLLLIRERSSATRGERSAQESDLAELSVLLGEVNDVDARFEVLRRRARLARAQSHIELDRSLVAELLEVASSSGGVRRRAEALVERASSLRRANDFEAAYDAAQEARALYDSLGDEVGSIECSCLQSEIATAQGSAAEMQRFIAEPRPAAILAANKALFARSTMAVVATALMQRDYAVARERARAALELYREMGDREGEAEAQTHYATALGISNRLDESLREYAGAADLCTRLGKKSSLGYLLFNMSSTELQLGRLEDARRSLGRAEEIFEALADRRGLAVCRTNMSMVGLLSGDPNAARSAAGQALDAARDLKSEVIEAAALSNLGNAERDLGDFAPAIAHMNEALAIRKRMGHPGAFEELSDLALAHLESGDVAAAVSMSRTTLARAANADDNNVWPHYCFWIAARAFHRAGEEREASAALERARALMDEMTGRIADEQSRAAFAALPMNAQLLAAAERRLWPV